MTIKKIVRIIFIHNAKKIYENLKEVGKNSQLLNSINRNTDNIKDNPVYGQPISKNKVPKEYNKDYGITTIFWVKLSQGWRMIYSLKGEEESNKILCIIIDILDHKSYSEKFGYKKS